jgi:hypothetical protein
MSKEKGRGVFASKLIKEGELVFTEKPIATCTESFDLQFADSRSQS